MSSDLLFLSSRETDALIARAVEECSILKTGDASWLQDRRIRSSLQFNAHIFGEGERTWGGRLNLTHPVGTAHRAFNFKAPGYETHSIASALLGLNHDTIEDFDSKNRTPERDRLICDRIMQSWDKPDETIRRDLMALTDSPGLSTHTETSGEQMARIHGINGEAPYSPRAMAIRYLEKLDTLEGDFVTMGLSSITRRTALRMAYVGERNERMICQMPSPVVDANKQHFSLTVHKMRTKALSKPLPEPISPESGPMDSLAAAPSP